MIPNNIYYFYYTTGGNSGSLNHQHTPHIGSGGHGKDVQQHYRVLLEGSRDTTTHYQVIVVLFAWVRVATTRVQRFNLLISSQASVRV